MNCWKIILPLRASISKQQAEIETELQDINAMACEGGEAPYDQWENYLHPAEVIEGSNNKYYYAYIKGNLVYDKQLGKFNSYKEFLENV